MKGQRQSNASNVSTMVKIEIKRIELLAISVTNLKIK